MMLRSTLLVYFSDPRRALIINSRPKSTLVNLTGESVLNRRESDPNYNRIICSIIYFSQLTVQTFTDHHNFTRFQKYACLSKSLTTSAP